MYKQISTYLLLTLLVITGFAGSIHSGSLTGKERKFLTTDLKDTKKAFLLSVKNLNQAQLNFKPTPESWSVKECAYHLAIAEKNIWEMAKAALKEQANPDKRSEIKITDEQLMQMVRDRSKKIKTPEVFEPKNAPYETLEAALSDFKARRADLIQYVKTTKDDLRNHVAQGPLGLIDAYQVLLLLSAHTNRHTQQIEEVKSNPNFPK